MKSIDKLYRLQDGTQADPKDCKVGKDGVWRHKDGLAVNVGPDGEPETIGGEAAVKAESIVDEKASGIPAATNPSDKTTI